MARACGDPICVGYEYALHARFVQFARRHLVARRKAHYLCLQQRRRHIESVSEARGRRKNEELLLKSSDDKNPTSWSRDGRFLLFSARDPKTKADLWVLPLDGDKKPKPFLQTEFNEQDGHFSPDGHWIAYTSDESGA